MTRFRFELARPADDADLRRVLAETPMGGQFAVSFRREPSYFEAAVVEGPFRQVIVARDGDTGRVVGFGSRALAERYVNGKPERVGYLSGLRLLAAYRNRGLVARGYAFLRRLHADGLVRLYLTTIAEGNEVALAVLTSGRAGLPGYHFADQLHTVALPLTRRRGTAHRPAGLEVRPAREKDLPALLEFLESAGPRRQFFPCYREGDFFTGKGVFRGLKAEDVLLAYRDGCLAGTLAAWDQDGFRQTVVEGYGGLLRWARPLYNGWARLRGLPSLPGPGEVFRHLTAALPLVADDDREVFAALLESLLASKAGGPWGYLLVGLCESDPLLAVLRSYRARCYTTRLYLVCWGDGSELRHALDGRPPYLEIGGL